MHEARHHRSCVLRARALAFGIAMLIAGPTSAQTTTGVILGTVRDTAGAVLPGVTVVAINTGTNARSEAVADERGAYLIPQLPPGGYRLEAGLTGFRQFARDGLVLEVQQATIIGRAASTTTALPPT
ncbi:MAG: carboxypeptidase-like regulatory domain-containing protein [Vicinamibacteraceae bacterium]